MRIDHRSWQTTLGRSALGAVGVALALWAPYGCGDDVSIIVPIGAGGAGGEPSSTATGGMGGEQPITIGVGGGLPGCPSGVICGDGACCAGGEECVIGACLPECESKVRCGDGLATCCEGGDVCVEQSCVTPGDDCLESADCPDEHFCEPTIGKCLPQPAEVSCEYFPDFDNVEPTIEWSWTESAIQAAHRQVINMPVVVDLEKDGTPDVVIVTSNSYNATGVGFLRALDGKTGLEKWDAAAGVYGLGNQVQPRGTPAAADIDGDGFVEIVSPKASGGLIAFEHDGSFKWRSTLANGTTAHSPALESATVAIADLEGDGSAEIVVGGIIYESDGRLRANGNLGLAGANLGYGAVSIIADLDGQMPMEVVTGRRAFRADGSPYWDNGLADGYPAIADLDLDGSPEIVVIANKTVRVQSPTTGAVLASLAMPAAGAGGPPTIANFDDDPQPEIASANGGAYAVFEYSNNPPALTLKWSKDTQDLSSNRTGSSVFDFQGDGAAEVVYGDECYFRVYDGATGDVIFFEEMSSATIHEYPVVVDVDGDNNTEVVVVANDLNHLSGNVTCPYGTAGLRHGVFVFGDAQDNWVRTRRVWNQHAYHIVNVAADGALPSPEPPSWGPLGFNNYRQSTQGAGVFNAPDLQVSLQANIGGCPSTVELRASVLNLGSLGVAAGIPVSFYRQTDAGVQHIVTTSTEAALLPGQIELVTVSYAVPDPTVTMSFSVVVDANEEGESSENECLEDNNEAAVDEVKCPTAS